MAKNRCVIKTANTAESRCKIELMRYAKILITPLSAIYTGLDSNNQEQTIEEWIEEGIHHPDPAKRFYPMPEITRIEDNSTENSTYTDDYGNEYIMAEGGFGFTQAYKGDSCLTNRLLNFNGQQFRIIIFDNLSNAQGVRKFDGFAGEIANIWSSQPKANTASELSQPTIKYMCNSPEEHKLREVISTDVNISEMKGLEDIVPVFVTDGQDLNITFELPCGGEDVTSELSPLDGETTAWVTENGNVTTAPIYNANKKAFTVSTSSLSAHNKLGLATPDILYELGITHFESELANLP